MAACFSNIVCCSYRVPLSVLCLDKIRQTNARQFFPYAVNIDTQSIIIHIQLIVPQILNNISARTDFSSVLEKVIENFQFVLGKLYALSMIVQTAGFQMQHCISIDDLFPLLCGIGFLQQRSNFRKQDRCCLLYTSFGRFNHIFYLTFNSMIKTKCCRNLLIAFFFSKKTG